MKSINQIRRERLRELVGQFDGGKAARFTERMGWKSPTLASRYLTESPKNHKPIGDNLAREIETAYGVEENYLDNLPVAGVQLGSVEAQLVAMFQRLSPDAKERVLGRVHALYAEEHNEVPDFGPTVFEDDVRERSEVKKTKRGVRTK